MRPVSKLTAVALVSSMLTFAAPLASAEDKIYTLSELDVVHQVVPEYPSRAARAGFDGWVELEFTVSPTGVV
jgi:outer membrane biosynthesis protein TonB